MIYELASVELVHFSNSLVLNKRPQEVFFQIYIRTSNIVLLHIRASCDRPRNHPTSLLHELYWRNSRFFMEKMCKVNNTNIVSSGAAARRGRGVSSIFCAKKWEHLTVKVLNKSAI